MILSAATTLLGGIFGWKYFDGSPEETLMMTLNGAIVGFMLDFTILISGLMLAKEHTTMFIMSPNIIN